MHQQTLVGLYEYDTETLVFDGCVSSLAIVVHIVMERACAYTRNHM